MVYESFFDNKKIKESKTKKELLSLIYESFGYFNGGGYTGYLFNGTEAEKTLEIYKNLITSELNSLGVVDRISAKELLKPIIVKEDNIENTLLEIWINILERFKKWGFQTLEKNCFIETISFIKRYLRLNNFEINYNENSNIYKISQKEVSVFVKGINNYVISDQVLKYYEFKENLIEKKKIIAHLWKENFDKNREVIEEYWGNKYWKDLNCFIQNKHIRHNNPNSLATEDELDKFFVKMSPVFLLNKLKT